MAGMKAAGQDNGFFHHTSSCMVNVTRVLHTMHFMLQVDGLLAVGILMKLSCSSTKKYLGEGMGKYLVCQIGG